jgi:cobalt transporter subunit CbtB
MSFLLHLAWMQLFSRNKGLALTLRKIQTSKCTEIQEEERMAQVKVAAQTASSQTASTQAQTARLLQASLAALLGVGLFMGVAFSNPAAVHNAAHDSRHGVSVPCH